ncbi:MAG: ABC transporter ATP-binding protein [Anaeroplasmataceae bacterium]|nr:ABC transporter ATP-binding protein [Anaeroplasmataceae bacterium]
MKIVLKNLTKVFTNKKTQSEVRAVDNLDIEIPDGKLVGLLGPSGCGKSTTLFMISGLQTPTSGRIFFGETDVTNLAPEKRGIGLVFQNYALYPHMTVLQNIMFPLTNQKISKKEATNRAHVAASLVQIEELLDRKPAELSGGQQQRVAIARALVKNPNVLLLDEPLSNLDARLRLQTREEIKRIQRETGVTTVFVTHDQEEAMSISDFIVVMKLGVVQQVDVPQVVYDDPINLFVAKFLGTPPINSFLGEIRNHKVYIGNDEIMETEFEDQEIYVGIRPEGFIVADDGVLSCEIQQLEVMGRDVSIIAKNAACEKPTLRAIVDADIKVPATGLVKFNLKPNKVFLFNRETEYRLGKEPIVESAPIENEQPIEANEAGESVSTVEE